MKPLPLLIAAVSIFACSAFAQITFRGCTTNALGPQDFVLTLTGTTNDGGMIRNTFESTPLDFNQGCPAGVCELRMIWNIGLGQWEVQLDNDGPAGTPDYTTAVLYFNSTASLPNPPDLVLGGWQDALAGTCPVGELTTLSGDVQNTIPVELQTFDID